MIAVISSEYSLQTCSPVKYVESAAIADEISAFLAEGGQIKQCEQVGVAHELISVACDIVDCFLLFFIFLHLISVACDIVVNDIAGKEVTDENHNP